MRTLYSVWFLWLLAFISLYYTGSQCERHFSVCNSFCRSRNERLQIDVSLFVVFFFLLSFFIFKCLTRSVCLPVVVVFFFAHSICVHLSHVHWLRRLTQIELIIYCIGQHFYIEHEHEHTASNAYMQCELLVVHRNGTSRLTAFMSILQHIDSDNRTYSLVTSSNNVNDC